MKILLVLNLSQAILDPYSAIYCSEANKILENIKKASQNYDITMVVNDQHYSEMCIEFQYVLPHCYKYGSTFPLNRDINKLKSPQVFNKHVLNALSNIHLQKSIFGYFPLFQNIEDRKFSLCGFSASTDIVATALGLIDFLPFKFDVLEDCLGDASEIQLKLGKDYLRYLNLIPQIP